jgi:LPS-assembly lipoprotein
MPPISSYSGDAAARFAKDRAQRNAQDRAVNLVAEAIRNRLASYFVAGT